MNRKSKVIVSIVGITIVLLALLGVTYAYYLTRIQGNTNTNSISITTADLKLEYGDGTIQILTKENIMPDNDNPLGTKDFTVSNTGNTTIENYKVVLEYAVIDGVVPSVFKYPEDFEITLTCVSKNLETNAVSGRCSGAELKWNNESIEIVKNTIDAGIRHEYSLEIYYKDSGIDQSDDMGKNLNLKVQIYGANETSTVTGTIDNVDETYAMKLNSNPKISTIKKVTDSEGNVKYQYKFIGVEHNSGDDSHTLTLVNKSNVEQSTGNITIKKGTNSTIDGSVITVKDNQTNIFLTTTKGESLTSTATFNPYSNDTNSLAYHIINNSINNANGTMLVDTPPSKVGQQNSLDNWSLATEENIYHDDEEKILKYTAEWITFQDCSFAGVDCDKVFEYDECDEDVIGKYVTTDPAGDYTLVSGCDNGKVVLGTAKYEKVLSHEKDDYGTSYYYRGDVKDNYVNFAGMCWRIVRIVGNGSIRLILDDKSNECNSSSYSGDWSIGMGNFGYESVNSSEIMNYLRPVTNNSKSMVKTFYDFQNNKLSSKLDKLKSGDWCIADNIPSLEDGELDNFNYDTYARLYNKEITLKCNGTKLNEFDNVSGVSNKSPMYVGTLTASEILYAGGSESYNHGYYLMHKRHTFDKYWTLLSPSRRTNSWDLIYRIESDGELANPYSVSEEANFRPSINLANNISIDGGDGTKSNPYIIN